VAAKAEKVEVTGTGEAIECGTPRGCRHLGHGEATNCASPRRHGIDFDLEVPLLQYV